MKGVDLEVGDCCGFLGGAFVRVVGGRKGCEGREEMD